MPETSKEYCAHGGVHCPYCGSEDIVGGSVDIIRGIAQQTITCLSCEKEWEDEYELIAYEPVE